jgi:tetratricopeptide (TPR) repeat protein
MHSRILVRSSLVVLAALAILGLSACEKRQTSKTPSTADVPVSVAAHGQTPTDDECRQFAKAWEAAVASGDLAAINRLIDWEVVLDRATADIEVPAKGRNAFLGGVRKVLNGPRGLSGQLAAESKNGGQLKLLRIHTDDEQQKRVLFRVLAAQRGLNYHDLLVVRQADGNVRAADIYIFATAEMVSQTFRRSYISVAADASKSAIARLTQSESDYVKHVKDFQEIISSVHSGRPQQALDIYARLPDSLKKDKNILVLRVAAASAVDEQQYDEAMDALRTCCPDDPCVDLIGLDSYFIHKKYAAARKAIDRLDKSLGGDPYLDVLRASAYLGEKRYQEARECAVRAAKAEQDLVSAYWTQVTIALEQKDFDEVTKLLVFIEKDLHVELSDLTTAPEYAEFVKSPQYQKWLQRQR